MAELFSDVFFSLNHSNREPIINGGRELEKSQQIELVKTQQQERSLRIAPILIDYIKEVRQAEIESRDYRILWQKEEQTLYLYKKSEAEPRLKIKYQNQKFEPIESAASTQLNKPVLTEADASYWQQFAIKLHLVQEEKRKRQQREQQSKQTRKRRRSR